MSSVEEEFNDPALKEAVCKSWSCDCAPTHLKNQIAELLSRGRNSKNTPSRTSWMIWPTAIAALLILSIGLFSHFHSQAKPTFAALPATLTADLIATHDRCCAQPDHQHLQARKDDDVAIAEALHDQLHRAVLVCRPGDDAWLFRGAAICPVGTTPSGHLVFAKGEERLSLFSLPKTLTPDATEGAQYSSAADQHCIVAFVKDGALFCLVESGPSGKINVDQLKQIQSQMQPAVTLASPTHATPVVLAELLHSILPNR